MGSATGTARGRRERDDRIVEMARGQHGVITRPQLVDLGLGEDAIDRQIAAGALRRMHRGVYAIGPILPPRASLIAAVLACGPRAVLSHSSAAALFDIVAPADGAIDVTVVLPADRARTGLCVHRVARLADDERTEHDAIPVSTPLRTLADLAGVMRERDLERAITRAERNGLVRPACLALLPERYAGRPGSSRLRAVLGRAGGPSFTRSEAEVRFLGLVRRAGLPVPRANALMGGVEIDFLWPDHGLAVEVDGYRYHASRASFEGDRRRTTHLASLGVQVIPLTWRQIVNDEIATVVQLAQALARRE